MNTRRTILRFLALAFFTVACDIDANAEGSLQTPSGDAPVARPQSTSESKAANWADIVSHVRLAVVVIETDEGQGSGFVIKPDGLIVTNYHVVANAKEIAVKFSSGEVYTKAYLLSSDSTDDLAFLKIEAVDLPTIPLGNSSNVQVGDEVLLVGTPRGLEQTVSNGLISGIRIDEGVRVIQTSAAASPGSSGGPLLNRNGEAVGVMSFKLVNGENLNFTIPINYVRGKMDTLSLSSGSKTFEPLKAPVVRHKGVWVAGRGSANFQEVYMGVLSLLDDAGVEFANHGKLTVTEGFVPLSTLLQRLPDSGASSLLYIKVEPGFTSLAATVYFQCYDPTGRILWEEKANDVLADGGNTIVHRHGWKSKLRPHVGQPGLLLSRDLKENLQKSDK